MSSNISVVLTSSKIDVSASLPSKNFEPPYEGSIDPCARCSSPLPPPPPPPPPNPEARPAIPPRPRRASVSSSALHVSHRISIPPPTPVSALHTIAAATTPPPLPVSSPPPFRPSIGALSGHFPPHSSMTSGGSDRPRRDSGSYDSENGGVARATATPSGCRTDTLLQTPMRAAGAAALEMSKFNSAPADARRRVPMAVEHAPADDNDDVEDTAETADAPGVQCAAHSLVDSSSIFATEEAVDMSYSQTPHAIPLPTMSLSTPASSSGTAGDMDTDTQAAVEPGDVLVDAGTLSPICRPHHSPAPPPLPHTHPTPTDTHATPPPLLPTAPTAASSLPTAPASAHAYLYPHHRPAPHQAQAPQSHVPLPPESAMSACPSLSPGPPPLPPSATPTQPTSASAAVSADDRSAIDIAAAGCIPPHEPMHPHHRAHTHTYVPTPEDVVVVGPTRTVPPALPVSVLSSSSSLAPPPSSASTSSYVIPSSTSSSYLLLPSTSTATASLSATPTPRSCAHGRASPSLAASLHPSADASDADTDAVLATPTHTHARSLPPALPPTTSSASPAMAVAAESTAVPSRPSSCSRAPSPALNTSLPPPTLPSSRGSFSLASSAAMTPVSETSTAAVVPSTATASSLHPLPPAHVPAPVTSTTPVAARPSVLAPPPKTPFKTPRSRPAPPVPPATPASSTATSTPVATPAPRPSLTNTTPAPAASGHVHAPADSHLFDTTLTSLHARYCPLPEHHAPREDAFLPSPVPDAPAVSPFAATHPSTTHSDTAHSDTALPARATTTLPATASAGATPRTSLSALSSSPSLLATHTPARPPSASSARLPPSTLPTSTHAVPPPPPPAPLTRDVSASRASSVSEVGGAHVHDLTNNVAHTATSTAPNDLLNTTNTTNHTDGGIHTTPRTAAPSASPPPPLPSLSTSPSSFAVAPTATTSTTPAAAAVAVSVAAPVDSAVRVRGASCGDDENESKAAPRERYCTPNNPAGTGESGTRIGVTDPARKPPPPRKWRYKQDTTSDGTGAEHTQHLSTG